MRLPEGFQDVVQALSVLPGVGERTASRFAFYLLDRPDKARMIAEAAGSLGERVGSCIQCFNLTDKGRNEDICGICTDPGRASPELCVVENVPHLIAMESAGIFQGRYHVLHGALSPIKGIGPDELNLPSLVERVGTQEIREVIVATDVDVEGEATAAYIREILEAQEVSVTRIATGVPMGSDIEYLDGTTLARALMGRKAQF